jgi:hypothetical protein
MRSARRCQPRAGLSDWQDVRVITHAVMFRFADPNDAVESKRLLESLPAVVEQIRTLWVGLDGTGSETAYHLVLVTTHDSWADLTGYLEHPEHVARTAFIREHAVARASVDCES